MKKKILLMFLLGFVILSFEYVEADKGDYDVYIKDYHKITSSQIGLKKNDCAQAVLAAAVIRVAPEDENGKLIERKVIIDSFQSNHTVFDDHVRTVVSLLNKDKNYDYLITLYENEMWDKYKYPRKPYVYKEKINKQNFSFRGVEHLNVDIDYYYPYNFNHKDVYDFMLKLEEGNGRTGMYLSGTYWSLGFEYNKSNSSQLPKPIWSPGLGGHAFQPVAVNKSYIKHGVDNYYAFKFFDPTDGAEIDTELKQTYDGLLEIWLYKKWYVVDTLLFIEKIPKSTGWGSVVYRVIEDLLTYGVVGFLQPLKNYLSFGFVMPFSICGDGFVEGAEECDHGKQNGKDGLCTKSCTWTFCGDGERQAPNGKGLNGKPPGFNEECDDGKDNKAVGRCTKKCMLTFCGDKVIQKPNGEDEFEDCEVDKDCYDLIGEPYLGWTEGGIKCFDCVCFYDWPVKYF